MRFCSVDFTLSTAAAAIVEDSLLEDRGDTDIHVYVLKLDLNV